jgi:hypothetical protein
MHIHSLRRAALAACVFAVLAASPAHAVTTQLRVEADGNDIGPGFHYVHDSVTYETATSCGGSGDSYTLNGPTALGLLVQAADFTRGLRPVQVSDEFDFGKFVCGVGGHQGSDTAFWSYKVDHVLPEIGADQFTTRRSHDEVLFYFVDGTSNSGNELDLVLRKNVVKAGTPVDVTVREYDAEGKASPADGVRLTGAGGERTDADGKATVVFEKAGKPSIRGVRGSDVPTTERQLCVWEDSRSECAKWLTGWVVGTDGDDRMRGTADPERITGRRGDDRINSRGGKADSVRCGPGDDVVRADQLDRVKGNCETVRRR